MGYNVARLLEREAIHVISFVEIMVHASTNCALNFADDITTIGQDKV